MARGFVNNNPGNIRLSRTAWQGEVKGNDPDFVTFDTPESGIRAMAKVLLAYQRVHGLKTIRQIINRWAPPIENDTAAYVADVAAQIPIDPDDDIDLSFPARLSALVQAIIRHENGQQPYSTVTIDEGVRSALA